jgi:hypothetical protein
MTRAKNTWREFWLNFEEQLQEFTHESSKMVLGALNYDEVIMVIYRADVRAKCPDLCEAISKAITLAMDYHVKLNGLAADLATLQADPAGPIRLAESCTFNPAKLSRFRSMLRAMPLQCAASERSIECTKACVRPPSGTPASDSRPGAPPRSEPTRISRPFPPSPSVQLTLF